MQLDEARDQVVALRRRAARFKRRGELRKATLALREGAALDPSGASYVLLAHVLLASDKRDEALAALRQALYAFRYEPGRARTVARLILALDPCDLPAQKRAAWISTQRAA